VVAENIPDELKCLPQWVNWKLEFRVGRWTKPPFQVDGKSYAKANDPQTWGSFEEALSTYEWNSLDGVGFEPTPELGLVFVDLDHCVDLAAKLAPWAMEIIERFNTYIERSPIDGIRIIAKGKLPRPSQKKARSKFILQAITSPSRVKKSKANLP
jgi:putative DNA primase/helicase